MKIITIALLLFSLSLSISMVEELNIYQYSPADTDQWRGDVDAIKEEKYLRSDVTADVSTNFGFGDFLVGLKTFIKVLWRAIWVNNILHLSFGLNNEISILFSLAVVFLYSLGLVQLISGRAAKGMQ